MKKISIGSILLIAVFISWSLLFYRMGYGSGYEVATKDLIQRLDLAEEKLVTCSADLKEREEMEDTCWQYVEERCVCVMYGGTVEPPLTRDEICDWHCDKGEYSEELGYCRLDYWEQK